MDMDVDVEREAPQYTEQQVWEKYLDVTREMLKFISKGDVETFLTIAAQRTALYQMLIDLEPHTFGPTEEGAKIRQQIIPMDQEIMYKARTWLNKSKRQNMAVKSYDITGFVSSGNVFNREY